MCPGMEQLGDVVIIWDIVDHLELCFIKIAYIFYDY